MGLEFLSLIIPFGFLLLMLVPAILAFRGKAYWATWTMLVAPGILFLTAIGQFAATYLAFQDSGSSSGSPIEAFERMAIIGMVTGTLSILSILAYAIALCSVAVRWKAVAWRADELELEVSRLAAQRDAP